MSGIEVKLLETSRHAKMLLALTHETAIPMIYTTREAQLIKEKQTMQVGLCSQITFSIISATDMC